LSNEQFLNPAAPLQPFSTHIRQAVVLVMLPLPSESGGTTENSGDTSNHLKLVSVINLWGIDKSGNTLLKIVLPFGLRFGLRSKVCRILHVCVNLE
jgi:hypothetical protein